MTIDAPVQGLVGVAAVGPTPRTLSDRIRAETRDLHDQIEANPRFARLTAPDLTRTEFRDLLLRLYGHHTPAERAIAAMSHLLPEALELQRRLCREPTMAADLVALGLEPSAVAAAPRCDLEPFSLPETAWGWLYVMEGSSMGGQLISRHVGTVLGIGPANGAGFLTPHGSQTGMLWRDLKRLMNEAAEAGEVDAHLIVAAARDAFRSLDRWMGRAA